MGERCDEGVGFPKQPSYPKVKTLKDVLVYTLIAAHYTV